MSDFTQDLSQFAEEVDFSKIERIEVTQHPQSSDIHMMRIFQ